MLVNSRYITSFGMDTGATPGVNVFWGKDVATSKMVLIRQEHADSKYRSLDQECSISKSLGAAEGFPRVCWTGTEDAYRFLVQEYIGSDLQQYALSDSVSLMAAHALAKLAAQMLERIRDLHAAGYVHRDIKPTSFAVRRDYFNNSVQQVYLLNFGLCQKLATTNGSVSSMVGRDFLFSSVNTLRNGRPSKRDDIESLAYAFVWLLKHKLPWEHLKDDDGFEGRQKAIACRQDSRQQQELRSELPSVFANFVAYALSLDSTAEPDYERWSRQLREYASSKKS